MIRLVAILNLLGSGTGFFWGSNRASVCLKPRISTFSLRLLCVEGRHVEISDVSCQILFQVETDLVALHWSAVGSAMIVWPPESRRWM